MFGDKYRCKSVEASLKEFESVPKGAPPIFVVDDNFAANSIRTKELMRRLIGKNLNLMWSAQVRTNVGKDPELLRLMKAAGCTTLYIGFESPNDEALKESNKKQTLEDIELCLQKTNEYGLNVHGMFILGLHGDNANSGKKIIALCRKYNIWTVQVLILTPLPGSDIFAIMDAAGQILHKKWQYYNVMYAVFRHDRLTPAELQWAMIKTTAKIYNWRYLLSSLLKKDYFRAGVIWPFAQIAIREFSRNSRKYLAGLGL